MCSIMGYMGNTLSDKLFRQGFDQTISRGPDMSEIVAIDNGRLGFHR